MKRRLQYAMLIPFLVLLGTAGCAAPIAPDNAPEQFSGTRRTELGNGNPGYYTWDEATALGLAQHAAPSVEIAGSFHSSPSVFRAAARVAWTGAYNNVTFDLTTVTRKEDGSALGGPDVAHRVLAGMLPLGAGSDSVSSETSTFYRTCNVVGTATLAGSAGFDVWRNGAKVSFFSEALTGNKVLELPPCPPAPDVYMCNGIVQDEPNCDEPEGEGGGGGGGGGGSGPTGCYQLWRIDVYVSYDDWNTWELESSYFETRPC